MSKMNFSIPVVNLEFQEVKEILWTKIQEPVIQRRLILVIVCIALLLDNMLYMVIVPIIPDYLRYIGTWDEDGVTNGTVRPRTHSGHQDSATGFLFASKAIVQLMVNPFSGALIDRIGYDVPMMIGLVIMFFSTAVFACGRSYSVLFFARSLQGAGSAFADTAGLAMIADRFTEEAERSRALGIALAFISFGCLVAPPFGGALYQFAGKEVPFLILALVCALDGTMLLLVMKPLKQQLMRAQEVKPDSIPIWRLLMDPYIAVCAGALMMSNVALAFLEPTISMWMEENLTTDNWKIGMIWLPAFFPHVFGVILTVKMARKYPQHQWLMAAGGLALEGLSCFIIPFSTSYKMLMFPICIICFGIALIDTALLPTLGYLVDVRYVSVYGSIYAIADISYSLAYAIGPIIAGGVVEAIGFTALNFFIAISNLAYAPVLIYLKHIYDFKPFESEANILMADPPKKEYQTYTMHDQRPTEGGVKNHLEYGQQDGVAETNIDQDQNGYAQNQGYDQSYQQQQYQPGYQEQGGTYPHQRLPSRPPPPQNQSQRQLPQQPGQAGVANPFRQQQQQQQQQPPEAPSGWRESFFSISKKWLSTSGDTDEFGFPENALPKVPIPDLDQTMTEYVRIMEPVLTQQQHDRLKNLTRQFEAPGGLGPILQAYLFDKRDLEPNWAYNYWLNDMYMDVRLPLPINSNPGMVLPPRKFTTVHDVARFAAQIIDGIVQYRELLDSGNLQKERATSREKNQPLCMAQYYRLLGSCRRPGDPRDSQYLPEARKEQHVIVCCRNQMYCVPVKTGERSRFSEDEIASQLLYILSDAPCLPTKPPPIGLLTAEPRSIWARDRQVLLQNEQNQHNIERIEQALVLICLDESLPVSFNANGFAGTTPSVHYAGARDESNMAHEMIHGGGSDCNTANRWFDKTMQIIICNDGTWGLCYEHSTSEGIAVVLLLEKILNKINETEATDDGVPQQLLPSPDRLDWMISPEISQRMFLATKSVDKRISDLDFYVYRYQGYGKTFIKSCKCSPDVYIQLALQLAYYKIYGHIVTTYESASTRRFLLGRVDCIRSASTEALEWAKAVCQGAGADVGLESDKEEEDESANERKREHIQELFREAVTRQTDIMVQNIIGQGIDIHLLGLREACSDQAGELCELFTDDSYKTSQCFLLSTSQVACSSDSFMGYGPVTPKGYGCSYNPHPDQIVFCVSSFYSAENTSAARYAKSLQESLDIMKNLLEH